MRLLNVQTFTFTEFHPNNTPPYVAASHRWAATVADETTYKDVRKRRNIGTIGYKKVQNFCEAVKRTTAATRASEVLGVERNCEWLWIDTACIDKTSSAELSESINSMYQWYADAAICYVFLPDVGPLTDLECAIHDFLNSEWFTRGWTLQELLAPRTVVFFTRNWEVLGHKCSLVGKPNTGPCNASCAGFGVRMNWMLERITGIPQPGLARRTQWYGIEDKKKWAADRVTTRLEDRAYCLFGLLGVSMPVNYGEGAGAWERLEDAVANAEAKKKKEQGDHEGRGVVSVEMIVRRSNSFPGRNRRKAEATRLKPMPRSKSLDFVQRPFFGQQSNAVTTPLFPAPVPSSTGQLSLDMVRSSTEQQGPPSSASQIEPPQEELGAGVESLGRMQFGVEMPTDENMEVSLPSQGVRQQSLSGDEAIFDALKASRDDLLSKGEAIDTLVEKDEKCFGNNEAQLHRADTSLAPQHPPQDEEGWRQDGGPPDIGCDAHISRQNSERHAPQTTISNLSTESTDNGATEPPTNVAEGHRPALRPYPNQSITAPHDQPYMQQYNIPGRSIPGWARQSDQSATFQCSNCPGHFTHAKTLHSHIRTVHMNERPFLCTICGKAFARQDNRNRHENLHPTEQSFFCHGRLQDGQIWGCGRRFPCVESLARHVLSEAGRVCVKPLWNPPLDGEAVERDLTGIADNAKAQGLPGLSRANFVPVALLAQYPALAGIDWLSFASAPRSEEDEISGRDAGNTGSRSIGEGDEAIWDHMGGWVSEFKAAHRYVYPDDRSSWKPQGSSKHELDRTKLASDELTLPTFKTRGRSAAQTKEGGPTRHETAHSSATVSRSADGAILVGDATFPGSDTIGRAMLGGLGDPKTPTESHSPKNAPSSPRNLPLPKLSTQEALQWFIRQRNDLSGV